METIPYPDFVGGAYRSMNKNASADRCINLIKETRQVPGGINRSVLLGTPGLTSFGTLATTPVRCLWAGDNRLFAVGGASFYEVSSVGTPSLIGTGLPTGGPAQVYSNGTQLWVVAGGQTYIASGVSWIRPQFTTGLTGTVDVSGFNVGWATGSFFSPAMVGGQITIAGTPYTVATYISPTLITITTSLALALGLAYSATVYVNAVSGTYLNGYFIALLPDSNQVCSSRLLDGLSTWPDLDYAVTIQGQDRRMAVYAFEGNLWILGQRTTEVWYPSAADGFPFSPIQGGFISQGIWARYSVLDVDSPKGKMLIWLAANEQGIGQVVAAFDYNNPQVISTPALDYALSQGVTSDAVAWKYQEKGHSFYMLTCPTLGKTFAYDATEGEWAERENYNGGSPTQQLQWCATQAFANGQIFVGSRTTGIIYIQGQQFFTDNGTQIRRIRTAPALSDNLGWTFYNFFQIDQQQGIGTAPSCSLEVSNDGGQSFGTPRTITGGGIGNFIARMIARQLGRSQKRVFQLTTEYTNDQVEWSNAYLGITPGAAR